VQQTAGKGDLSPLYSQQNTFPLLPQLCFSKLSLLHIQVSVLYFLCTSFFGTKQNIKENIPASKSPKKQKQKNSLGFELK